ncbi:MAG: hypothetical protein Fues2KO_41740 [Fuerstiella sp.]
MRSRFRIEVIFQRSVLVMVSAAAWVLASAEGTIWPGRMTVFVALASHLMIDRAANARSAALRNSQQLVRRRAFWRSGISVPVANTLGIIAFVAMAYEFYGNTLLGKLLAGAHLLIYMTWIVLWLNKGIRQYWWLCALSVLQISVASILTNAPEFGAALVAMLFVMVWTLSVFSLYRASLRLGAASEQVEDSLSEITTGDQSDVIAVSNGLQMDDQQRWIGPRFFGSTASTSVASLILGVIAFAVFPRFFVSQALSGIDTLRGAVAQRTGFTESVELGDIGQIMQSDQRVLQFEIRRIADGASVSPDQFATAVHADEIMFRGNALGHYSDSRWAGGAGQAQVLGDLELERPFSQRESDSDYRLIIQQDPPVGKFAFAPTPISNARLLENRGEVELRRLSYSLLHQLNREAHRTEPLNYEVWCSRPDPAEKEHVPLTKAVRERLGAGTYGPFRLLGDEISIDAAHARSRCITDGLQEDLPQLWELAHQLCQADGDWAEPMERVRRIESYLTEYGRFQYSLNAAIRDPSIDPVEDFLFNRRSGHCEYFASSGALMMQAVGVPARVVNGYKGCDLNSVTNRWEVKQRHAHAWVEAFVDDRWVTIDPTPAAPRERDVRQTNGPDWWSDLRTAFSDNWYSLVQKMSLQRQEQLVRPLINSIRSAWQTIREQGLLTALKIFYNEVILNPQRWISWRGWLLTFLLLLGPGLWLQRRPKSRLREWLRRLREWARPHERRQRTVVRFYETFCQLCRRNGMLLPATATASEAATAAVLAFDDRLPSSDDRRLPERIANAFNKVRFGDYVLTDEQIATVRDDVQRLEQLLKRKTPRGFNAADADNRTGRKTGS